MFKLQTLTCYMSSLPLKTRETEPTLTRARAPEDASNILTIRGTTAQWAMARRHCDPNLRPSDHKKYKLPVRSLLEFLTDEWTGLNPIGFKPLVV